MKGFTTSERSTTLLRHQELRQGVTRGTMLISLELFDSRPLNLYLLDLVLVVYITCCCSFCVLSYFQVLIEI
jgi:hypothetical protein